MITIRSLPNTKSGTRNYAAEMVQLNDSMTWETVCEVILLRKTISNFDTLVWELSGQACRDKFAFDQSPFSSLFNEKRRCDSLFPMLRKHGDSDAEKPVE